VISLPEPNSFSARSWALLANHGLRRARPKTEARGAPIALLGVPFDNVTTAEVIRLAERMIRSGRPHYMATANLDFLAQAWRDVELRRILIEAHLVLCDGTPLLWASRWLGNALPERVAGSDLVPLLIELAARKGYRPFFLGGSPEATSQAVTKLQTRYPSLSIAGHYSPPFQPLLEMDHADICRRIEAAKPDMLFVSFGCPKQEKWIAMHYRQLGVPVSIGVGGTIDFLAGRLSRAPRWMQRTGTEWIYRLAQEPRRLFKRYVRDGWCFGLLLAHQWRRMRRLTSGPEPSFTEVTQAKAHQEIECPEWLDAEAVRRDAEFWEKLPGEATNCILDLSKVLFLDSTGAGLLIRLRKRASLRNGLLILARPSSAVTHALKWMRLDSFFLIAPSLEAARAMAERLKQQQSCLPAPEQSKLSWQGEITAANADAVWKQTEDYLRSEASRGETQWLVDLSAVSFIDSTGLGVLIRARKYSERFGAQIKFAGMQPNVRNVIEIARLDEYLLNDGLQTAT
jgi:N-acetylglucosaminyldiphosphoundecaprenol N-acetyl-beta-D-mannosaminyltransferase